MKSVYCFAVGMKFLCNIYCLNFKRKSTFSAAIYLLPLFQRKTNTSALELLTEIIRLSPGNFFLTLCSFECSHVHGKSK